MVSLHARTHAHARTLSARDGRSLSVPSRPILLFFPFADRLHYCACCDEEWLVFDREWPDQGVSCAGMRAGECETISAGGFMASSKRKDRCTRCASTSVYGRMYSKGNLQHLGPRYEPLSRLTWFESLLIARVHPVISVVTLTSTGLLCYAGHVCNYYIKVMEWFKGLPAILRDKRWFLVKRRKSLRSSGTETVHKKPTTANRQRLEAGIHEAIKRMPNVYANSELNHFALQQLLALRASADPSQTWASDGVAEACER